MGDCDDLWCFHTRARQRQDNDKTKVEPVHFYYAFHTRSDKPGVKGIIEMHRFNFCLVVVLSLSCSGVKAPLQLLIGGGGLSFHSSPCRRGLIGVTGFLAHGVIWNSD